MPEETVGFVENTVEVVEHIAANVAKQLPEDGSLQKAVEEVEHLAEVVDADAEKVEAVTEKVCFHSRILLLFVGYYHAILISILKLHKIDNIHKLYHCKLPIEQGNIVLGFWNFDACQVAS
jgi:hypothetical protein